MATYLLRRLVATVPLLLVGSFVVFALTAIAGDPLARLAGTDVDRAVYDTLIERYALDDPVPVRYLDWLLGAVSGDLGTSTAFGGAPVAELVASGAMATLRLVLPAFLLGALAAVTLGVVSALRPGSAVDTLVSTTSFVALAIPTFITATALQVLFGVWWPEWTGWRPFPVFGVRTTAEYGVTAMLASHVLPVLTLTVVLAASQSRYQRAAMLEVLSAEHLRTARSKGVGERAVVLRHGLRNALLPVVTVWAIDLAALLGGAVVTETVFAWPGLGRMLVTAVVQQDLHLTTAIVMLIGLAVVVCNLVADAVYAVLDPRIRHG
jgi:peptide/nickel transport system permease protein